MSKLLNSGHTGHPALKSLKEQKRAIVDRWNDSGLLDGLKEGKINIAELLESEASMIITNPFNLTYHIKRLGQVQTIGDIDGMEFHLRNIIRLMSKNIMEDHCE